MKEIVHSIFFVGDAAYSGHKLTQGLYHNFIMFSETCEKRLHRPSFRIAHDIYPRHKFEQFNEYNSEKFSSSLQYITFNIKMQYLQLLPGVK